MSAPERIWAFFAPEIEENNPQCTIVAGEHCMHGAQQYIRADLAPQWHRIDDPDNPPPRDGTEIDLWYDSKRYPGAYYSDKAVFEYGDVWPGWQVYVVEEDPVYSLALEVDDPTHWMPLHKPPQESKT